MTSTSDKPRILLVDDEPQLLAGLRIHLRRDFEVHIANGGAQAIELMRELDNLAVIVSDMRMPGMNGVEVLRTASQTIPETTRILLTGYADVENAIGAVNEGKVFRFLTKPCSPVDLRDAISEAVEHHQQIMEERAFVRGERHRVTDKTLRAGQLAAVGAIARGAGRRLHVLAAEHSKALDQAIERASNGAGVSLQALRGLRDLEDDMFRAARCLKEMVPDSDVCEELDVRGLADRAVDFMRVLDGAAEVEVVTEYEAGLPAVLASGEQIENVLMSFLTNAIDALRPVTDRPRRIVIRVYHDRDAQEVVGEVEDNGVGIHPEARPFVLRPYFSTKGSGSTGLGLAVAEKLVDAWGGRISFDSRFGRGTRFRFHLPSDVTCAEATVAESVTDTEGYAEARIG